MKVLIVDDSELLRKMVKAALEPSGVLCLEAGTVSEALIRIKEDSPDLCFLDLHLPDADGLTLLRLLRAPGHPSPLPKVFLLTGSDDGSLGKEAVALGARGVLRKPVSPEILLRTLNEG